MAPDYDGFTASLDYEPWLAEVLPRLEGWGLAGKSLLDVGCGTGKSLIPMLRRGWRCSGCDISEAMVEVARRKVSAGSMFSVADMRDLPRIGCFDLVWSLNDSINYLDDRRELEMALRSMRRNMAKAGLLVFDLNTILTYRTYFAERWVTNRKGRRIVWDGRATSDQAAGSVATAAVEVENEASGAHVHRQRHFPEAAVLEALARAALEPIEVFGQDEDGCLHLPLQELTHVKALYVARRRSPQAAGRTPGKPVTASREVPMP